MAFALLLVDKFSDSVDEFKYIIDNYPGSELAEESFSARAVYLYDDEPDKAIYYLNEFLNKFRESLTARRRSSSSARRTTSRMIPPRLYPTSNL